MVTGCEQCMAALYPEAVRPPPGQMIGPAVPGLTEDELTRRARAAGFVTVPELLRNPDEVILVLACPHVAG
jgi:hypothetical protein